MLDHLRGVPGETRSRGLQKRRVDTVTRPLQRAAVSADQGARSSRGSFSHMKMPGLGRPELLALPVASSRLRRRFRRQSSAAWEPRPRANLRMSAQPPLARRSIDAWFAASCSGLQWSSSQSSVALTAHLPRWIGRWPSDRSIAKRSVGVPTATEQIDLAKSR